MTKKTMDQFTIETDPDPKTLVRVTEVRKSIYDELTDKVLQLEPGKSLALTVPKGAKPVEYRNAVQAGLLNRMRKRAGVDIEQFRSYTTADGRIEIHRLAKTEKPRKRRKVATKSKARKAKGK